MKLAAIAVATAVLGVLGTSPAQAGTIVGDTVLFQGCSNTPLFPTDCTGLSFFTQQTTIVTADATDQFVFGVSTTNVQANSIVVTLGPGAGKGAFFNGILVKGIDFVGAPADFITGFTLTGNTMGLLNADVLVFNSGHSIAVNFGDPLVGTGEATINLLTSTQTSAVPEPTTLLLLGSGFIASGLRRSRGKQ